MGYDILFLNTGVNFVFRAIGHRNESIVPSSNLQEDLLVEVVALPLLVTIEELESEGFPFLPEEAYRQVMLLEAFLLVGDLSALGRQVEA